MNCPVCNDRMREVQKYGIEMDICPGCKGVWLDRGELEQLLDWAVENSAVEEGAPRMNAPQNREFAPSDPIERRRSMYDRDSDHDDDHEDHDRHHYGKHEYERDGRGHGGQGYGRKKRGSWLMDLFEGIGGD